MQVCGTEETFTNESVYGLLRLVRYAYTNTQSKHKGSYAHEKEREYK